MYRQATVIKEVGRRIYDRRRDRRRPSLPINRGPKCPSLLCSKLRGRTGSCNQ